MSNDHDFLPLEKAEFHDAGDKGLVLRMQTRPSPTTGRAYVYGCLLDENVGRALLFELTHAVEQKFS